MKICAHIIESTKSNVNGYNCFLRVSVCITSVIYGPSYTSDGQALSKSATGQCLQTDIHTLCGTFNPPALCETMSVQDLLSSMEQGV